jgi:hypothetical protein
MPIITIVAMPMYHVIMAASCSARPRFFIARKAGPSTRQPWQAFVKIQLTLLFLALRTQNALEAENSEYPNKRPGGGYKNPAGGIQAELLFHV